MTRLSCVCERSTESSSSSASRVDVSFDNALRKWPRPQFGEVGIIEHVVMYQVVVGASQLLSIRQKDSACSTEPDSVFCQPQLYQVACNV